MKPHFMQDEFPCHKRFSCQHDQGIDQEENRLRSDQIVLEPAGKRARFPVFLSFVKLDCMSKIVIAFLAATLLIGCAKAHPVIYPNTHYQDVGRQAAQQDIANCMELAQSAGVSSTKRETGEEASKAAGGTAAGAATGAVGGAIAGGAAIGSIAGAATGLTAVIISSMFQKPKNNPVFENFVNRCLQERGYEIIGWE